MMRRALRVGILGGVLLTLAGVYPIMSELAPLWFAGWERPFASEIAHRIWLVGSAVLAALVLLGLGFWPAHRAWARGGMQGFQAGALAGTVTGLLGYLTLVLPTVTLAAYGLISANLPAGFEDALPSPELLQQYVSLFEGNTFRVELFVGSVALVGGLQGALLGWWRRHRPGPERPSLLTLLHDEDQPVREWFADNETAVQTGLWVGGVLGGLAVLVASGRPLVWSQWPALNESLRQIQPSLIVIDSYADIISLISPLFAICLFGVGLIVVLALLHPPNRYRSRFSAIILAGVVIWTLIFTVGLRLFFLNGGLAPFLALPEAAAAPETAVAVNRVIQIMQIGIEELFRRPGTLITAVLAAPWLVLAAALLLGLLSGFIQGIIFAPLAAWLYRRPVDRAARLERQIRRKPEETLPLLYGLFAQTSQAYEILAHLVVRLHKTQPDVARVAAGIHTLGTGSALPAYEQGIEAIQQTCAEHREWRWALAFGSAFKTLSEVLQARTLDQILAIDSPPARPAADLPPLVDQSGQRISRIVTELHKVEKVEDSSTKLIFLENGLSAIDDARSFVRQTVADSGRVKATLPQQPALLYALDHWQEIVLRAIKQLQGRADVVSALKTKQCAYVEELPLVFVLENQGLNVAQQVQIGLNAGDGYHLLGIKSRSVIEILPPGEAREVTLYLAPQADLDRLRVVWAVTFDDAVDDERHLDFADVVTFSLPERPFDRIFPIPYVTGTPLKSVNVFVGREDVFDFIKENVVGAHQNNIIILHGQRRTGKTSVLYRLRQVMADTHVGVIVDMQGKPARGEADFLYAVADDIVYALEERGIVVPLPPRAEFEEAPEFFFRARFIRGLASELQGKNLLLMFDEFEELQQRVEDGRLQPDIFQFLRNLMQHEDHLDFIFAGTRKLEELDAEYWSVLFNIAVYRPISFLSAAEMRRLILEPVAGASLEYDPLAIERIIQVTAGHPYFAQLLLHEMIVYHNEMEVTYLTAVDVDQVIERVIGRGEAHFRTIWSESSQAERWVLQALAALMTNSDAVNEKAMRVYLAERGYETADRWRGALANLESRDILTRQNAKSPLYGFKVDLIRLWIDQTRPPL